MNSCYKCIERHIGCHSTCGRYAEDKRKFENDKAALREAKKNERAMYEYIVGSMNRKGVLK